MTCVYMCILTYDSENTKEGYKTNKLEQILLNGNNICVVSFELECVQYTVYSSLLLLLLADTWWNWSSLNH